MLFKSAYICIFPIQMSLFHYITMPPLVKSLTLITKSAKLSGQLIIWEPSDPFVSLGSVSLNAVKWDSTDDVANVETRLNFKKSMGYLISLILVQYWFLRSKLKTSILTKNSCLQLKKKLKRKRLTSAKGSPA